MLNPLCDKVSPYHMAEDVDKSEGRNARKARRRGRQAADTDQAADGARHVPYQLGDVARKSGMTPKFIADLRRERLIDCESRGNHYRFPEAAVEQAKICAELAGYGLQMRHMRAIKEQLSFDNIGAFLETPRRPREVHAYLLDQGVQLPGWRTFVLDPRREV